MAILLEDKGRYWKRYRHSAEEKIQLHNRGLQHVLSSNVSAVGTANDDLIIRFHNGSLYKYHDRAHQISEILGSNSKGKWVHRELRHKNAKYARIGSMPLESDRDVSDEELFGDIERRAIRVEEPHVLNKKDVIQVSEPKKRSNTVRNVAGIIVLDSLLDLDASPIKILKLDVE